MIASALNQKSLVKGSPEKMLALYVSVNHGYVACQCFKIIYLKNVSYQLAETHSDTCCETVG